MATKKKAIISQSECVACGCCVKACPKSAIQIHKGIYAVINYGLCLGCGKCSVICPADVIRWEERA